MFKNMPHRNKKLKAISTSALVLFIILFVVMIIHICFEYINISKSMVSSAPAYIAFFRGIFYVPFLIGTFVTYYIFKRKLKKEFPELYIRKEAPAKVVIIKRMLKVIVITLLVSMTFLIIAPFIAIPIYLNRHVNYSGYVTENYPMQGIYEASDYGLDEKQMYLETKDGLNIWCSEIYVTKPKAIIIYLSGIVQPSVTYFYGHAKYMKENGYASILLEVRGHGQSEGDQIALGYEETYDVEAVVKYIKSEEKYNEVPIVLHGVSMGGAVAINAFGQIDDIDALIGMSAYSTFEDVTMDIAEQYGVPKVIRKMEKVLVRQALKMVFGSHAVDEISPIKQIRNTNGRPVLLISCTGDKEVPTINTKRLYDANNTVSTWYRDSWEHFIVKDCDFVNVEQDKEYWEKITEFLENSLE